MRGTHFALASFLWFAVLTIWVDERWAWSLFQIGIFALAGARILTRHAVRLDRAAVPLAAAAAWPMLQLALGTSVSPGETSIAALDWFTFLVVFVLACDTCRSPERRRWLLSVSALFGASVSLVATVQSYASPGSIFGAIPTGYTSGVFGPFLYRNQFAAWLELLLPVSMWLAILEVRLRSLWGTTAIVMYAAVVSSASRAGIVFASAEVLCVFAAAALRAHSNRGALTKAAVQFVALAGVATAVVGWHEAANRWKLSGPETLRAEAVRASLQVARDYPWSGTGLGTWRQMYPRYAAFDSGLELNQAHNDWVQWAAEGGLPFAIFLAIFALLLWKPAFRSIYGLGTVVFLAHALMDYPMQQRPALAAWFFAVAGATVASYERSGRPHELLRRTRSRFLRVRGRDPSGIQTFGPAGSSGSLQR